MKILAKVISFEMLLFGLAVVLKLARLVSARFRERLREQNMTGQIQLMDGSKGRYFMIENGAIRSRAGIAGDPDAALIFKDARLAVDLMLPPTDWLDMINSMKEFKLTMIGDQQKTAWFFRTLNMLNTLHYQPGEDMGDGVRRYVSATNGGPVHAYVKDGRIIRVTPIEFTDDDAGTWSITVGEKKFTPPRRTSLASHGLSMKSSLYSKDRLLYPMKRADFDIDGERNPQNRGISGYERISWDEAFDMVAKEITRVKKEHGPGAMATLPSAHHMWGNIGYYLSAAYRLWNMIGHTQVMHNPDSWEGWYWGAMHHWGHSMRCGLNDPYGCIEDCLKNAEMIVFWSSDPETTGGCYGSMEGTVRRQWAQELGIRMVHIDPFLNQTAQAFPGKWISPYPGTSNALALAIGYVWVKEELYDRWFIENRTTGFEQWREHLLGNDGTPAKTPEWAETECGVPAREIRALAREWGTKRTYLGAGGMGGGVGGANRNSTGVQWARSMVCLMAMQGIGRPGVNLGNLQWGTPIDYNFYFPGYGEGGISGDLVGTGSAISLYQRMPHLLTMNPVKQVIPRLKLPEAIIEGHADGYMMDLATIEGQFVQAPYPTEGHSRVHMLWRYGGSSMSTTPESNRLAKMYRHESLEFVLNQSVWDLGESQFADIILPACTNFERWDIGEWSGCGGYAIHLQSQLNHRVIHMQHKLAEPLGESRSDYEIFHGIAGRLGLGDMYSEGMTELEWVRRMYEASDMPKVMSFEKFLKKGYYVVPPEEEANWLPPAMNWFYEGRKKEFPDPAPLPSEYKEEWLKGLQTPSGLFEFAPTTLKRFDPDDPQRPVVNTYYRGWEGRHSEETRSRYPLQVIAPHPRYSFHTMGDNTDSFLMDITDHRLVVEGWPYKRCLINSKDAEQRDIRMDQLIKIFNDRGGIVCAAFVSDRIRPGTLHIYESSGIYRPLGEPGNSVEIGGCINQLSSRRMMIDKSHSCAGNAILAQAVVWDGRAGIQ